VKQMSCSTAWFGSAGQENFVRHKDNDREQSHTLRHAVHSIKKYGVVEENRGSAFSQLSHGDTLPHNMITFAHYAKGFYIAKQQFPDNPNVKCTERNGLHVIAFSSRMPKECVAWIRDFSNQFVTGGVSFVETIDWVRIVDAQWLAHADANKIHKVVGAKGKDSLRSKTWEWINSNHKDLAPPKGEIIPTMGVFENAKALISKLDELGWEQKWRAHMFAITCFNDGRVKTSSVISTLNNWLLFISKKQVKDVLSEENLEIFAFQAFAFMVPTTSQKEEEDISAGMGDDAPDPIRERSGVLDEMGIVDVALRSDGTRPPWIFFTQGRADQPAMFNLALTDISQSKVYVAAIADLKKCRELGISLAQAPDVSKQKKRGTGGKAKPNAKRRKQAEVPGEGDAASPPVAPPATDGDAQPATGAGESPTPASSELPRLQHMKPIQFVDAVSLVDSLVSSDFALSRPITWLEDLQLVVDSSIEAATVGWPTEDRSSTCRPLKEYAFSIALEFLFKEQVTMGRKLIKGWSSLRVELKRVIVEAARKCAEKSIRSRPGITKDSIAAALKTRESARREAESDLSENAKMVVTMADDEDERFSNFKKFCAANNSRVPVAYQPAVQSLGQNFINQLMSTTGADSFQPTASLKDVFTVLWPLMQECISEHWLSMCKTIGQEMAHVGRDIPSNVLEVFPDVDVTNELLSRRSAYTLHSLTGLFLRAGATKELIITLTDERKDPLDTRALQLLSGKLQELMVSGVLGGKPAVAREIAIMDGRLIGVAPGVWVAAWSTLIQKISRQLTAGTKHLLEDTTRVALTLNGVGASEDPAGAQRELDADDDGETELGGFAEDSSAAKEGEKDISVKKEPVSADHPAPGGPPGAAAGSEQQQEAPQTGAPSKAPPEGPTPSAQDNDTPVLGPDGSQMVELGLLKNIFSYVDTEALSAATPAIAGETARMAFMTKHSQKDAVFKIPQKELTTAYVHQLCLFLELEMVIMAGSEPEAGDKVRVASGPQTESLLFTREAMNDKPMYFAGPVRTTRGTDSSFHICTISGVDENNRETGMQIPLYMVKSP
ncbi:unnamed protein product, partial [Prorocentrum cordatum]